MRALVLIVALVTAVLAGPARAQELVRLPTRPGVVQPVWIMEPAGPPTASVILFSGGNGIVGAHLESKNFLVRSRQKFVAQGFLVAIVDVPSDHPEGLDVFRASEEHAQDVATVIAYLRHRAPVPVWLVGTSRGTISAANAAARLKQGGPDGLVLTSTILAASRRAAPLAAVVDVTAITVPTVFVHNREDACPVCPFGLVEPLMARFTNAPKRQLITVTGGATPRSDPCEALSRHGYFGIEDEVVSAIARAIRG